MTRQEALDWAEGEDQSCGRTVHVSFVNKIFDDIAAETCEKCIHYGEEGNDMDEEDNKVCLYLNSYVNYNFGCKAFELKE